MSRPRTVLEPDDLLRFGHELEHGDKPMWQLGEEFGAHPSTLRDIARREGFMWRSQRARKPMPIPVRPPAPPPVDPGEAPPQVEAGPLWAEDAPLPERVQRQLAQALSAIERIVPQLGAAPAHDGAERTTRTLVGLVKALQELRRLKAAETAATAEPDARATDDDGPETLAELRRSLCERLEALVARDAGGTRAKPEGT